MRWRAVFSYPPYQKPLVDHNEVLHRQLRSRDNKIYKNCWNRLAGKGSTYKREITLLGIDVKNLTLLHIVLQTPIKWRIQARNINLSVYAPCGLRDCFAILLSGVAVSWRLLQHVNSSENVAEFLTLSYLSDCTNCYDKVASLNTYAHFHSQSGVCCYSVANCQSSGTWNADTYRDELTCWHKSHGTATPEYH